MLLVDYNHPATWWFLYRAVAGRGDWYTYGRHWFGANEAIYRQRAEWLAAVLPSGPGIILGCGFGFTLECLAELGRSHVLGIDTSNWIHAHLGTEASSESRISQLDITDPTDREQVPGDRWLVTEDVLSSYDDPGVLELVRACDALAPEVFHIVSPHGLPPLNGHALDTWASLAPHHRWFDPGGQEA